MVKESGGMVFSITGRDGGEILKLSDGHILIPTVNENSVTAHTEGLQAYMWYFLVSHPDLDPNTSKWEGTKIIDYYTQSFKDNFRRWWN